MKTLRSERQMKEAKNWVKSSVSLNERMGKSFIGFKPWFWHFDSLLFSRERARVSKVEHEVYLHSPGFKAVQRGRVTLRKHRRMSQLVAWNQNSAWTIWQSKLVRKLCCEWRDVTGFTTTTARADWIGSWVTSGSCSCVGGTIKFGGEYEVTSTVIGNSSRKSLGRVSPEKSLP